MMIVNNVDEEDEDVVIQNTALYEHLLNSGYTDFESISIPKKTFFEEKPSLNINIRATVEKIYEKLFSFYSWITQEKNISGKQLSTILNAETLLNDHSSMINDTLTKYDNESKRITLQGLIVTGGILAFSTCISICEHKILPVLLASSMICCTSYIKYLRFRANRDLKNVILLQNELFTMCKKGLKILRYNQSFLNHLLGEKYLIPLTETLIKFMENISHVYYQYTLLIVKLLPADVHNEELFTKFEKIDSYQVIDQNYQALKKLYHIYLLTQSEMLYLLAIAYDSNTWIRSRRKMPETKLARAVHALTKILAEYKIQLSKPLEAYETFKREPIRYKIRNIPKWHNATIQMDLASQKLYSAYNQVLSVFKAIDDCIAQDTGIDSEAAEALMQQLDKAFKDIGIAKSLAEFVVLLMARSGFSNLRGNRPLTDDVTIDQNPTDLPIIIDSDPEILDEVFEEYIKEEYLRPLQEVDEYTLEQQKLDKLLMKNFMSELKEALVDKHKSMSERESKALQRIYKNISKDLTVNKDCQFIPAPPPMPSYYIWSTLSSNVESNTNCKKIISTNHEIKNNSSPVREKIDEFNEKDDPIEMSKYENIFSIPFAETTFCEDKDEESLASLPQILLETQATQFIARLPPAFLQEETFIGSGENSEDEIVEDASDNKENYENSQ